MNECDHKWAFMETVKQRGERASFGISAQKQWKRVDRFYCEKCLEIKEIIKTAPGWEDKPEWFD